MTSNLGPCLLAARRAALAIVFLGICLLALGLVGCEASPNGAPPDVSHDVPADGGGGSDAAVDPDVAVDPDAGASRDATLDGSAPDTDEPDAGEPDAGGEWDYRTPWVAPHEEWSACPAKDYVGGLTLREKAAYYDWIVPALHQVPADTPGHEDYSHVFAVACSGDVPAVIVGDDELPACTHTLSENSGLWTSLYVASQAFRYAATGEADALRQLRRTLAGTWQMLRITGKAGLYARDLRDPTLPQQYCIEDEEPYASAATDNERYARYTPPAEGMVGNQFVRVAADGCFQTWDTARNDGAGGWVTDREHCTDPRFAGFCWQRNASKDEYAGHVFAAGIVARLVDDPDIHAMAVSILGEVGHHLVDHEFWINDYDGRDTRYGSAHAMALDELPGSNALMALAWIKAAAVTTGDADLVATYEDCLLQRSGERACIDRPFERPRDYRLYLDAMGLALGCRSNYDTISIALLNYFNLVWYERDEALRALYRDKFRANTKGPDAAGRDLWSEADPFRNMILVSMMEPGQYDVDEVKQLIGDSVCSLKRFPTDNIRRARDATIYEAWCQSDRHGSLAAHPIPVDERCSSVFEWWGDPNEREVCGENRTSAEPPAGFLLPYWMGRYFGFIDETL